MGSLRRTGQPKAAVPTQNIIFVELDFSQTREMLRATSLRPVYAVGGAEVVGGWGVGGTAAAALSLTKSFSSLLGLKKGIFLAGTSTRSPVLGLRPTRGLRWRVRKLPKPRISILSPARSERTMLSKIVSTTTSLSLRVNSTRPETSSIRSALVIITVLSNSSRIRRPGHSFVTWIYPTPVECRSHNLLKFQGLLARGSL